MASVMQPTQKSNAGTYAMIGQLVGSAFGGPAGGAAGGAIGGAAGAKPDAQMAPSQQKAVQTPQAGPVPVAAEVAPQEMAQNDAMQRKLKMDQEKIIKMSQGVV